MPINMVNSGKTKFETRRHLTQLRPRRHDHCEFFTPHPYTQVWRLSCNLTQLPNPQWKKFGWLLVPARTKRLAAYVVWCLGTNTFRTPQEVHLSGKYRSTFGSTILVSSFMLDSNRAVVFSMSQLRDSSLDVNHLGRKRCLNIYMFRRVTQLVHQT